MMNEMLINLIVGVLSLTMFIGLSLLIALAIWGIVTMIKDDKRNRKRYR